MELRKNKLTGSDFNVLKELYPNLYKVKLGGNPIKSIDALKVFQNSKLTKLEITETDISKKTAYKEEIFKLLPSVMVVDNLSRNGDEVDSTIYDEEGGELDDDEGLGEEGEDDDDDDGEGIEDDDEEDEESEEPIKNVKKTRRE